MGGDGIVRLLEAQTGREVRTLGGPTRDPRVLGFSPDGRRIAVGDANTILVWRTDATGFPDRYESHGGRVLSAAWSADGATLATGAEDGTVIEWDTTGRHHVGAVLNDDLGDDTGTLWTTPEAIVVGQFGGRLLFVDPADGSLHPGDWTVPGFGTETVMTARTGVGGHLVVTADRNGRTAVWDARTRKLLGTVELPTTDGSPYAPTPGSHRTGHGQRPSGTATGRSSSTSPRARSSLTRRWHPARTPTSSLPSTAGRLTGDRCSSRGNCPSPGTTCSCSMPSPGR